MYFQIYAVTMEITTILWNQSIVNDSNFANGSDSSTETIIDNALAPSFTDYVEFKVAKFINDYYLYLVCVIGIPGNLACIMTLTSMKPLLSSAIYMLALAVADVIALALKISYIRLTAEDVRLGDIGCRLIFMMGTMWQMYANWVLVALTIERFLAIWFPLKVRELSTKRNTLLVLSLMLLFFALANLQFLFTYEEVHDQFMVWDCRPKPKFAEFINKIWYWIDAILYALLPTILLLVFNSLIIFAVRRSGKKQRRMTFGHGKPTESLNQQRQITTMLLTSSIIFVILVLPNSIFFIVKNYWTWRETSLGISQYYLLLQIIFLLSDLSHALNFYLYCLSGRKFRQHFLKLICPCRNGAVTKWICLCCNETGASMRPGAHRSRITYDITTSSATNISTISISPNVTPIKHAVKRCGWLDTLSHCAPSW